MVHHQQISDGVWVNTVIDLDEPGWTTANAAVMRLAGRWYLIEKETRRITLAQIVREGDQPYYVARHCGAGAIAGENLGFSIEVIAYGIGKKHPSGIVERMWYIRETGMTVMGDDLEELARPVLVLKYEAAIEAKRLIDRRQALVHIGALLRQKEEAIVTAKPT